ncbi:hypothetical protein CEXT_279671 [Caerostris extrusa]|uniref:Uncharacterized protein n=1 Tax=Caerostris extrusa TaxID=172846 RepID=A0AAV4TJL1_CAEEX|nr:hypothetical protein CEXT_279671 [Caerostris extrusa]
MQRKKKATVMERKGINEEKAQGREKEEEIRHRDKALFQGIPWQREKRELIALACSACAVESAPQERRGWCFQTENRHGNVRGRR